MSADLVDCDDDYILLLVQDDVVRIHNYAIILILTLT